MNQATLSKIGHNAQSPIDELGEISAQIADLEAKAKVLKEDIKAMGTGRHDGALFSAMVSEIAPSESYDSAAMQEKLRDMGVDDRWFSRHVKIKAGYLRIAVKDR